MGSLEPVSVDEGTRNQCLRVLGRDLLHAFGRPPARRPVAVLYSPWQPSRAACRSWWSLQPSAIGLDSVSLLLTPLSRASRPLRRLGESDTPPTKRPCGGWRPWPSPFQLLASITVQPPCTMASPRHPHTSHHLKSQCPWQPRSCSFNFPCPFP